MSLLIDIFQVKSSLGLDLSCKAVASVYILARFTRRDNADTLYTALSSVRTAK